jgi:hypothetical protein
MKKLELIKANILANKDLNKAILNQKYYTVEQFISDCERYLKAIEQRRMFNTIKSVSASGMSRNIKFTSMEKGKHGFYLSNYNMLFTILGFSKSRSNDFYFTIGGCGMDMIFHTNYTIIHKLHRLGFINKAKCDTLAQATPQTV